MSWTFQPAEGQLQDFWDEWDAFSRTLGHHVLLDARFAAAAVRHWGANCVFIGRSDNPRRPGIALAQRTGPVTWEVFKPSQAPLGLILLPRDAASPNDLSEIVAGLPGLTLQLGVMGQDPDISALPPNLNGEQFEIVPSIGTPRLKLDGSYEEFWAGRGRKLRENVARYRRRVESQGHRLSFIILRGPEHVANAVREHGRLESSGWKGKEGTAIREDNRQGAFYRDVLETFCQSDEGFICQLLLDDIVVASRLALVRDSTLVMLKTAYDEAFSNLAPGMLLMQELVKHLCAGEEIHTVEFYGQAKEWHTHWTQQIRTMYHLNCFRYRWVGQLRSLVKRPR